MKAFDLPALLSWIKDRKLAALTVTATLLGLYIVVRAKISNRSAVVEAVVPPKDKALCSTVLLQGLSTSLKVHPRAQYFTLRWKGTDFHDMEYDRTTQVLGYIEGEPQKVSRRYTYHPVTEDLIHQLAAIQSTVHTLTQLGCTETSAVMGGAQETA